MNKIAKISMLALGATMVTQALQAQTQVDGDLILGFASSSANYVIDLGQIPTSANTQLGGSISLPTYNSTFNASLVSVGVVGGDVDGNFDLLGNGNNSLWTTTLRVGTDALSYGTAGTESAPHAVAKSPLNSASAYPLGLELGVTGVTTGTQSAWSQLIARSSTQTGSLGSGNFAASIGNPMADLTGPITLDLWQASADASSNPFTYIGDLQIDMSGATPSVVFDPVAAVPEPSTYGLFTVGGIMALGLRRKFVSKNA